MQTGLQVTSLSREGGGQGQTQREGPGERRGWGDAQREGQEALSVGGGRMWVSEGNHG